MLSDDSALATAVSAPRIEWPPAVFEEIRLVAMEAFFALRHGGVEIGGVLFGTHVNGVVRILAARPLECEHAFGPSFALSERDDERLRALLDEGCGDLAAVGWYTSHTRTGVCLSSRDVQVHARHFKREWQVVLVVHPHAVQPMRAGLFVRGEDGGMHLETRRGEFVLPSAAAGDEPSGSPPPETAPLPEAAAELPVPAFLSVPQRRKGGTWLAWAVVATGVMIGGFVLADGWTPASAQAPPAGVPVRARSARDELQEELKSHAARISQLEKTVAVMREEIRRQRE